MEEAVTKGETVNDNLAQTKAALKEADWRHRSMEAEVCLSACVCLTADWSTGWLDFWLAGWLFVFSVDRLVGCLSGSLVGRFDWLFDE